MVTGVNVYSRIQEERDKVIRHRLNILFDGPNWTNEIVKGMDPRRYLMPPQNSIEEEFWLDGKLLIRFREIKWHMDRMSLSYDFYNLDWKITNETDNNPQGGRPDGDFLQCYRRAE